MAILKTINLKNTETGEIELEDRILETSFHHQAVKDSVLYHLASKRQGSHSTKTRAEVSYSTRKLYRQKGTGNARAGSAKSPIRRHGGVTFGPRPRDYSIRLNKKYRKLALRSAFAEKIRQQEVCFLENMELEDHKPQTLNSILQHLNLDKVLIVVDEISENLKRASGNLKNVAVMTPRNLNVYQLLRFPKLAVVRSALPTVMERM